MESWGQKSTKKEGLKDYSRRDFIKKLGLAGVAILGAQKLEKYLPSQESLDPKKDSFNQEVHECKEIIESKNFESFLSKPYIVSALYYSDTAMEKMAEAKEQSTQQAIILAIHKLITPEIREGYLSYLEKLFPENSPSSQNIQNIFERLQSGADLDTNHRDAIDLFGEDGSDISAISDGVVVLAEDGWTREDPLSTTSPRGGNTVIVYNPHKKEFHRYAHLNEVFAEPKQIICAGEILGTLGNTGINASKPNHGKHLHFEINVYDNTTGRMKSLSVHELKERI